MALYGYFYCICLLHIIVNNDILKRVLKSVTKNGKNFSWTKSLKYNNVVSIPLVLNVKLPGKSLLWVAALGLVILYIYAVVSFAFIHESFLAPDNNDATLFCSTLYECFASTIRYGLLENLGLVHYYTKY